MEKKTQRAIITSTIVLLAVAVGVKFLLPKKPSEASNGGSDNSGGGTGGTGGTVASGLDYRSLAKKIFDACDGYGTNEDRIVDVFKQLRNNADFDALTDAYGVREVSSGTGNIFQSNFKGDLSSTLRNELSSSWIDDINDELSSKGISRRI